MSAPTIRRIGFVPVLLVIFGAGAVLMALEILAMRLIAKSFGSALREMSAVIAVFLTAMSAGYALGGRIGDLRPRRSTLAVVLFAGGLLTVLVPFIEDPVATAVFESTLPLAMHAATVTTVLFALPAFLIASVTPIATRLRMRDVAHSGSVAGSVSAMSTVGSIVGTIGAGYVLIEYLKVTNAISLLGWSLCALGAAAAQSRIVTMGAMASFLLLSPTAAVSQGYEILLERDTSYHHIVVRETAQRRYLFFDRSLQGSVSRTDPNDGAVAYTYYMHSAFVIAPEIRSAAVLGLGAGTVPTMFLRDYPEVTISVAELDPVVVEVAREYFGYKDDPRLTTETVDGRVFMKRTQKRFDLVVLDAFGGNRYGITIPPHMSTREFFEEVKAKLTPNGLVVCNSPREPDTAITQAIHKTMAAVFPEIYLFGTLQKNTLVVGLVTPRNFTQEQLLERARTGLENGTLKEPSVVSRVKWLQPRVDPEKFDVPVLTDDFAPVARLLRGKRPKKK